MHTNKQRKMTVKHRLFDFIIEDVSLFTYLVIYCLVVITLGLVYFLLTPLGEGLGQNSKILFNVTFWDGLYFSVVTVSSLGYGDIYPIGLSKAIASIEVLFGLASLGIIIAKVTSRRLSHHVLRLYSSDAQKRLEEFSLHFEHLHEALLETMRDLGKAYQMTPKTKKQSQEIKESARSRFRNSLSSLHAESAALSEYISFEAQQSDFFNIAPIEPVRRLGNGVDRVLYVLEQLIISLSPETKSVILDGSNRQRIIDISESYKKVCELVLQYSKDEDLRKCFLRIIETPNKIIESYHLPSIQAAVSAPPDQTIESTEEQQETNLSQKEKS